jgi:hypothetical protein
MKKRILVIFGFAFLLAISDLFSQQTSPIIIDHNSTNLDDMLENEWVNTAKQNLYIGYGHTSHGSQLISGMNALMSYYTDGRFNWSRNGGNGNLRIIEGGTLDRDCGYAGWDDKTRTYLNATPQCNVIIWSWCGQVNDVDLNAHYLNRMAKLELDYPNVKFVYMTGHLEGQGPIGSLETANNKIRDFCNQNNKILFDFADIEKYSPDGDINYDELNADDGCNYKKTGGGTGNWANEWLQANPEHILTKISVNCQSCAHSVSLNCVRKGVASWYMWARIAGWDGKTNTNINDFNNSSAFRVYPNPLQGTKLFVRLENKVNENGILKIINLQGEIIKQINVKTGDKEIEIDIEEFSKGIYIINLYSGSTIETAKLVVY